MPLDYKIIGKNIQTRRKQMHVTQQRMAEDLFLSTSLISKVERGVKPVSLDTFQSMAEYLKTDIAMLVADPDDPEVHHNYLINEINTVLEDLDNNHLQIVSQLMKVYSEQIQKLYKFPNSRNTNQPANPKNQS